MDSTANSLGPESIQGHIGHDIDLMLDESEYEYEDEGEDEGEEAMEDDDDQEYLELIEEKKAPKKEEKKDEKKSEKKAEKKAPAKKEGALESAECHQYCEKIKGGGGYVDKRCPPKCQKELGVKAMPAHYDDPSKVRARLMKRFHFGRKGPARHGKRRPRRRR